jgi:hypothetical protein
MEFRHLQHRVRERTQEQKQNIKSAAPDSGAKSRHLEVYREKHFEDRSVARRPVYCR